MTDGHGLTRRTVLPLLAGMPLVSVTSLPGRAADAALVEAAQKEGVVTWYTSFIVNALARPMADAFRRKYNIRVDMVTGITSDIYQKITAEGQAGSVKADVASGFSIIPRLIEAGYGDRFTPDSAKGLPDGFIDPKGYWTNQLTYFQGPVVNTSLVKAADFPKTKEDLLNPKWKGKMVWAGGGTGSGPLFIAVILKDLGQEAGMEYLRKLAAQDVISLPANQRVVLDQVISGEYPIGLGVFNHQVELSRKKGAPIEMLKVDPFVAYGDVGLIIKNGPHPNAGRLFLDFILSGEGQEVIASAGYVPASPKAKLLEPVLSPEGGGFRAVIVTPDDSAAHNDTWTKIYRDLFVKS